MSLSRVKNVLNELEAMSFQLSSGELVSINFLLIAVDKVSKHFIN
ncbi:hypothetical protein [uncultured Dokdonia sp.]|nr:hypothetical protein [uncultured Dokdonia sp.]